MAFSAPVAGTAASSISHADLVCVEKAVSNLARRSTFYLKQVHTQIHAKKSFSNFNDCAPSRLPTNEMGHLLVGKSCPMLVQRYRIKDLITHGTFSQIFRAVDLYRNTLVAIKVMRVGYNELGTREYAFLKYFERRTLRGQKYCK